LLTRLSYTAIFHENPKRFSTTACNSAQHHQVMENNILKRRVLIGEVDNGLN
jgi:hypothetical protein